MLVNILNIVYVKCCGSQPPVKYAHDVDRKAGCPATFSKNIQCFQGQNIVFHSTSSQSSDKNKPLYSDGNDLYMIIKCKTENV